MEDEVADDGGGNKTGEGEDVGDSIDVLMRSEMVKDF
jgi:hypothetical protein